MSGKTVNIAHYLQTAQPNSSVLGVVMDNIDFYYCKPLLEILTLAELEKVNRQQNLFGFISCPFLNRSGSDVVLEQFSLNILTLLHGKNCTFKTAFLSRYVV